MTIDTTSVMHITHRPPIAFTKGEGSWLWDNSDKPYLDFVQGWAVNCLGHCPPAVVETLSRQAGTLINCSPAYHNAPMVGLANLLAHKSGLGRVFFANSGAEANEGAIKLARKWGKLHKGGAHRIITTIGGFHGRTLATMAASGKPGWDDLFPPRMEGFDKVPFNDLAAVEAAITPETVAVMLEPIQGEAGVVPATDAYLIGLRDLTTRHGLLLILDEVQTGIGRTGKLFGFEHAGVAPDIMALGKGLGAGVPLAALLCGSQVACFEPGDQGGTFNGNPLMTAVGETVVKTVSDPLFLAAVEAAGAHLTAGLDALATKHGLGAVRGKGLLLALDLRADLGPAIVAGAFEAGLLINSPRPDSLRFMPALNISHAEIDQALDILDKVCAGVLRAAA